MIADLRFENFTVESFSCLANMNFDEEALGQREGNVGLALNVKRKSGTNDYMIEMDISLNQEEESFQNNPYRIAMRILGFFTFKDGEDPKKMSKMVHLNGTSMLYGIARGIIAQITANGPHGRFLLPAVNMKEALETKKEADETKKPE